MKQDGSCTLCSCVTQNPFCALKTWLPVGRLSGDWPGMIPQATQPAPSGPTKETESSSFKVTSLIEEVPGEVSCSSWNSTCSLWAAGTRDGHVHVWEKTGVPGTLSEMQAVASWQASSQPISHVAWSPATSATQLAVSCSRESGASQPSTSDERITEGEIGIWGPVSCLFETPKRGKDSEGGQAKKGKSGDEQGGATWRRRTLLAVPSSVGPVDPSPWRRVLSLNFLEADSEDDPLLLLLAAVTAEGKLLVFSSTSASFGAPKWSLRDQVCLTMEALANPGQANLTSAVVAVHPSADSIRWQRQREACLAVAVHRETGKQGSSEAKVWAYTRRFLRWYPVADLAESLSPGTGSIHDVAWRPHVSGTPADVIALATSQGLKLLRLTNPPPAVGVLATPSDQLQVEQVPTRVIGGKEECWRVSWHWSGSMLAVVSGGGGIGVWKEDAGGVWVPQCKVQHGTQ